ncbi:MAG: hypothetical protein ACRBN8_40000 [Nannocystales bacterium]
MSDSTKQGRDAIARYRDAIGPSATQRATLLAGVERRLDLGGPPDGGIPATPAPGMASGWWVLIAAVVAAAVGLAVWPRPNANPQRAAAPNTPTSVPVAVLEPATPDPASAPAPPAKHSLPPTVAAIESPDAPLADAPRRGRKPITTRPGPRAQRHPKEHREAPPTPPPPSAQLVDEEVRLLRSANAALRAGRHDAAQRTFDDHARRFPKGALVELREVGRALLGCEVSPGQGHKAVAAFEDRYPDSLHTQRIRRACTASQ